MSVVSSGKAVRRRTARDLACYHGPDADLVARSNADLCLRHHDLRGFLHWRAVGRGVRRQPATTRMPRSSAFAVFVGALLFG